jgi:hypothetical protein
MYLHTFHTPFDTEFLDFLKLGWDHIIDIKAYDHLLFVMTLCALFTFQEWRKILVIVTAFTIGHSLTLALSALDWIVIPAQWTDVLIPFTILFTAITNLIKRREPEKQTTFGKRVSIQYLVALFFGLIHGLGFANNFKFMLGEETSIVKQLFAFNTGLELGQMTIVVFFLSTLFLMTKTLHILQREWTVFFSGAGAALSCMMILNVLFA